MEKVAKDTAMLLRKGRQLLSPPTVIPHDALDIPYLLVMCTFIGSGYDEEQHIVVPSLVQSTQEWTAPNVSYKTVV